MPEPWENRRGSRAISTTTHVMSGRSTPAKQMLKGELSTGVAGHLPAPLQASQILNQVGIYSGAQPGNSALQGACSNVWGTHLGPEKGTCAPCIWVEPRDIAERPVIQRPQRHYPIPHGSTARGKPRPEKLPEVMPLGRGRSHQAGAWIRLAHGPAWPHSAPLVSKIWAASWNLLTTPVRRPSRRVKGTARTFQDGGQISPQESEEG